MRAAAVQLNSTDDYDRNLEVAERLVRAAAEDGAEFVALPEKWTVLGPPGALQAHAEPLDGPALTAAAGWARLLGIHLLAGSIAERIEGHDKIANSSVLFGPDGAPKALYRKIHMFDVDVEDVSYRESAIEEAGDEVVASEVNGTRLGMTICYDLRFPELYRILALHDVRMVAVPSAFTERTGRDHWEVLLRARAIENQAFMIAPNQVGDAPPNYKSYGRSMIVDPWGVILAQAADTECFVSADLDFSIQNEMRESLPSLRHRRAAAYRWPDSDGVAPAAQPASIAEPANPEVAP
jgi:predicted amidohydrolase